MISVQFIRGTLLAAGIAIAAVLPASGAAEIGSQTGVVVDLNKGVWVHGPDLPSARQDAAVAVMDGRIYLVGGFGPHDEQMATLLVLEPTFPSPQANPGVAGPIVSHPGEWRVASTIPESVDHAAAAGLGGYLYVAGGRIEDLVTNKFWRYDPVNDDWTELPSMPFPRYGANMQAVDGKLYVLAGQSSHGNNEKSMMIFDPKTNAWTSKEYALGTERFLAGSVVIDNKIYLVGGRDRNDVSLRYCDIYDPERDRWSACTDMHYGRADFGLAAVNNRLMAIGGENIAGSSPEASATSAPLPAIVSAGETWGSVDESPFGSVAAAGSVPESSAITLDRENRARAARAPDIAANADFNRTITQTTEISSTDALGWISGPWLPFPRHGMAVTTLGNQIWVIGGSPFSGTAPLTSVLRFVSPVTQIRFQKGHVQP